MTQLRERAEKLEYDDVAIPHADEPLGQATVFPIVQQEERERERERHNRSQQQSEEHCLKIRHRLTRPRGPSTRPSG